MPLTTPTARCGRRNGGAGRRRRRGAGKGKGSAQSSSTWRMTPLSRHFPSHSCPSVAMNTPSTHPVKRDAPDVQKVATRVDRRQRAPLWRLRQRGWRRQGQAHGVRHWTSVGRRWGGVWGGREGGGGGGWHESVLMAAWRGSRAWLHCARGRPRTTAQREVWLERRILTVVNWVAHRCRRGEAPQKKGVVGRARRTFW